MSTGTTKAASGGQLFYVESAGVLSHLLLAVNRTSIALIYSEPSPSLLIHSAGAG
jgi:hypothetical protein